MQKNTRGFTLIELMVVVTVLAILAATATLLAGTWNERATMAKAVTESRCVLNAVDSYVAVNDTVPTFATDDEFVDFANSEGCPLPAPDFLIPELQYSLLLPSNLVCWCQPCSGCPIQILDPCPLPGDPQPTECVSPSPFQRPWSWYMELEVPNISTEKIVISPNFGAQAVDQSFTFPGP